MLTSPCASTVQGRKTATAQTGATAIARRNDSRFMSNSIRSPIRPSPPHGAAARRRAAGVSADSDRWRSAALIARRAAAHRGAEPRDVPRQANVVQKRQKSRDRKRVLYELAAAAAPV